MVIYRNGKFLILLNHLESRKVEVTRTSFSTIRETYPVPPAAYFAAVIFATIASREPFLIAITPLGSMR